MQIHRGWVLFVAMIAAVAACGGKEVTDTGNSTPSGLPSSGSSSSSSSSSASSSGSGGPVCEGCYDEPGTGCPVCPGEGGRCDGGPMTQCKAPFVCGKDNTCITGCANTEMCGPTQYCSCSAGGFASGDAEAGPMGCQSGQCAPQKPASAACTNDGVSESNDCAATLHCALDSDVCIPPAPKAAACLIDTDCASTHCDCGPGNEGFPLHCTCS